jgi:hypothetical protein
MGVKFSSTKLANSNKKGILTPDEEGYYTLIIGGLNAYNSNNQYYTLKGADELFKSSSSLMRRIANGNLRGELGHPKQAQGMSLKDYISRLLVIEETNVCSHFKEVWLDVDYGKNNPEQKNDQLVAVLAKIKPSGAKASALESSLNNPNENVNFSVRSFTRDYVVRGIMYREIAQIVCWDNVNEPGIAIANKWNSPSLESFSDINIELNMIEDIVSEVETVANEDCKQIAKEIYQMFTSSNISSLPSIITKW